MRHCYLCHQEFPEGTRMVLDQGGTNICVPCSETPRGKFVCKPFSCTEGYRESRGARATKWQRINRAMMQTDYQRKKYERS